MPKGAPTFPDVSEEATKHGKHDLERLGLFIEMPYLSAKTHQKKKKQAESRNIMCEGPKSKNGTQHGYFEDTFKRIFSKEALAGRGRKPQKPKFKNVSERAFMPPSGPKFHATPGDHHGTFGGIIEAFSNKRHKQKPFKTPGRNIVTGPGKKGSYGYADTGLSPYPEHLPDRYGLKLKYKEYGKILGRPMVNVHYPQPCFDKNPFKEPEDSKIKPGPTYVRPKDKPARVMPPGYIVPTGPSKWQGGCHGGCFEKFPEHLPDRPKPKRGDKRKAKPGGVFIPPFNATKTLFTTSIMNHNIGFRMTKDNYDDFQPVYVKYLMSEY